MMQKAMRYVDRLDQQQQKASEIISLNHKRKKIKKIIAAIGDVRVLVPTHTLLAGRRAPSAENAGRRSDVLPFVPYR